MSKKLIKRIFPEIIIEPMHRLIKQVSNFKSLACNYGQWITIRDWKSVDKTGEPIPWYTYPAIEYLAHLDFSELSVFEYGSGNSTLWWKKKAKSVVSVENNKMWFEKISQDISIDPESYLFMADKNEYVSSLTPNADIYIIDGSHREACAEYVAHNGISGIMIVFDNSERLPETLRFLREKMSWFQVDFHGFGPINGYTWTTSVFINPDRFCELSYGSELGEKYFGN